MNIATTILWLTSLFLPSAIPQALVTARGTGVKSLATSCSPASTGGTGVTTLSCGPFTVVSGQAVVAIYSFLSGADTSSIADTLNGATFSNITAETNIAGTALVKQSYKCNSAGGSDTITVTMGGTYSYAALYTYVIAGASTSCFDTSSAAQGNGSTNPQTTATITTASNDFVIANIDANSSPGSWTAYTGWTLPANGSNSNTGHVAEYQVQGSSGSITGEFVNSSTGSNWMGIVAGYK